MSKKKNCISLTMNNPIVIKSIINNINLTTVTLTDVRLVNESGNYWSVVHDDVLIHGKNLGIEDR